MEDQIAQQGREHNAGILINADLRGRSLLIGVGQEILSPAANRPTISSIPIALGEGSTNPGIIRVPRRPCSGGKNGK